ncbi:hypothetical protein F4009_21740 [Candidatus Poribacteria bacterium]|nr:hypothetical protein [Candidatus Poribacteria bacterium]MYK96582.1 hypothetical protein [Candidatus Poribacteria bacterium]
MTKPIEQSTESLEESHVYSEEEAEEIYTRALIICAEALQGVLKDVQELRADFSALYHGH